MNGPQQTAVSRKELWQKWKQNEFLIILGMESILWTGDSGQDRHGMTISRSYSRQAVNSLCETMPGFTVDTNHISARKHMYISPITFLDCELRPEQTLSILY